MNIATLTTRSIVVSDQRFARDGRYIEKLGTFDPLDLLGLAGEDEVVSGRHADRGGELSDLLHGGSQGQIVQVPGNHHLAREILAVDLGGRGPHPRRLAAQRDHRGPDGISVHRHRFHRHAECAVLRAICRLPARARQAG